MSGCCARTWLPQAPCGVAPEPAGSSVDSAPPRAGPASCTVDAPCHQLSGYFGINSKYSRACALSPAGLRGGAARALAELGVLFCRLAAWPPVWLGPGVSGASEVLEPGTGTGYLPQPLPTPGAWCLPSQGPPVGTVMWPQAERSRCLFAEVGKTTPDY